MPAHVPAKDTVLIIEDEPDVLDLLRLHLRKAGFAILEAADGVEGLKIARANGPPVRGLEGGIPVPRTTCKNSFFLIWPSSFAGMMALMKTEILTMMTVALAVPVGSALANEVRLEDCPAAVQQAVLANSRDGRVDDIELSPDGQTYEVEVNLPRLRERQLRIAADGTVRETAEDIDLAEAPEPVQRTVTGETAAGARLEEIERKTAAGTTVFLAEIDLPDSRDLYLEVSDNGSILNRLVRD